MANMSSSQCSEILPIEGGELYCMYKLGHKGNHSWQGIEAKQVADKGCPVNHPSYYNSGKIEVIDFIEDQKLGFHMGTVVKYISRAGKKDPAKLVEDLEKARWYLTREIERLKQ